MVLIVCDLPWCLQVVRSQFIGNFLTQVVERHFLRDFGNVTRRIEEEATLDKVQELTHEDSAAGRKRERLLERMKRLERAIKLFDQSELTMPTEV